MKIINIIGSPRTSGNGATIAQLLLEGLENKSTQAHTIKLNELSYRGCQSCMACKKTTDTCVARDDLTEVLEEIRTTDLVLLSSPVYFGEITAQLKGLLDRFYSFLLPDFRTNPKPGRLAAGKKLVLIIPQGNPAESAFADLIPRYSQILKRTGFDEIISIRATGVGVDSDVRENAAVLSQVQTALQKICS